MRELALFAGGGGTMLAGKLIGFHPVCAVELDPYCRSILLARQRDGWLPRFPIWDDVVTFDGKPWRGHVDIITGGFPCQDISLAGKRVGISGPRSGLWTEFARIIGEVRPRFAFIENVPALATGGLDRVLADLAALGMDARWCCLGADDVGAPHIRKRLWILATDSQCRKLREQSGGRNGTCRASQSKPGDDGSATDVADTTGARCTTRAGKARRPPWHKSWGEGLNGLGQDVAYPAQQYGAIDRCEIPQFGWGYTHVSNAESHLWGASRDDRPPTSDRSSKRGDWWAVEPDVDRVVNGLAHRMDQLRALGNGWVPHCAALAWWILTAGDTGDRGA